MAIPNIYTHRKVADTASKPCEICYKPSTSVLVAPDNKDFFFACSIHMKDKGFCSPIIDEAAIAAKKKEMEAEVKRVKQEFDEKQRKKEKEKGKETEKGKDKKDEKDEKTDEKDREKKSEDKKKLGETTATTPDEEARVFALQRTFYQQRLDKKRNAEIAKRNRERLQNPNLFPQVPKGIP